MNRSIRAMRTVTVLLLIMIVALSVNVFINVEVLRTVIETAIANDAAIKRLEFTVESFLYLTDYNDDYAPSVWYCSEVPLEPDVQQYLYDTCQTFNVDVALALAVMETESGFDSEIVGDGGRSYGLMQINKANWDDLRMVGLEPFDIYDNIRAGVMMLSEYLDEYEDTHLALMCYNGGERYARNLWDMGVYETNYSCKVVASAEKWERALEG